jgi:signal transduction histidine kinase
MRPSGTLERGIARLQAENEQLRRTTELQSELLGIVAHELRNPTSVIAGFAELLQRKRGLPDQDHDALTDMLVRQASHMSELIDSLLATSSLLYPDTAAAGDITTALAEAERYVVDAFGREKVQIDADVDGEVPAIDRRSLKLILTNLIGNAVKHSTGGRIEVRSRESGGLVEIEVSNEAPPIPPQERDLIFEPFKRAKGTNADGVGLGLHIVKRFSEAYGGSVAVDCVDGRVIFVVRLPRAQAGADRARRGGASRGTSAASGGG